MAGDSVDQDTPEALDTQVKLPVVRSSGFQVVSIDEGFAFYLGHDVEVALVRGENTITALVPDPAGGVKLEGEETRTEVMRLRMSPNAARVLAGNLAAAVLASGLNLGAEGRSPTELEEE